MARNAALGVSTAAILALTLIPLSGRKEVELVPLGDLLEAFTPSFDPRTLLGAALNVLLFAPFGAALALRGMRSTRIAVAALVLAAAVEACQLLFVAGRTVSVDDVLLNGLGAVLGGLLVPSREWGDSNPQSV